MRVIIDGKVKRAPRKGLKMKQIPPKKKKNITKATNQSIEETISFVVNGHLTPKKLTKKRMTLISKNDISETTAAVKNNRESRKPITTIKTKRANVKVKTLKGAPRKQVKRSTPESTTTSLSELKIATSAILAQTIENDSSEKQVKKGIKLKQSTKTKTECRNVKKQAKKNIPILRNSLKSEENEKKSKDKKSKIIIQKVKKLPAVKVKASVTIKQKGKVGKLKQTVNVKPKKSAVSSHEPKQVKQDVKPITTKLPKNNPITEEALCPKLELIEKKPRKLNKKKIKVEYTSADETSSTSDEFTLDALRQHRSNESAIKSVSSKKIGGKAMETNKKKTQKVKMLAKSPLKSKMTLIKKGAVANKKTCAKRKVEQRNRKLKLYSFWNGPKRHRVASLNALAKVHCLYENETRGTLMDNDHSIKSELIDDTNNDEEDDEILPTRTLRSAPGLRGAGKHWEMHDDTFSSSEDNENSFERPPSPKPKVEKEKKKPSVKRRRNRCELIMDLKDMVVRKRMASLNASAILAASYSVEKRSSKSPKSEVTDTESDDSEDSFSRPSEGNKKKCFDEDVKKEEDRKVIEVQAAPNKKVSVILNQDTDVTITGVYVNSTTRSTHHEGYCSIAGMQYRISAKSHTQTASTTVATETILQSAANMGQENNTTENAQQSCKSYTPLSALSSMQPPGTPNQHGVPQHVNSQHVIPLPTSQHTPHTSPVGRHHGCTSAFSAPPPGPYGPPPPPPPAHHTSSSAPPGDPNYIHGKYLHCPI
ncbi:uncharacterized protein LOC116169077 [Photinus pyralis]|uniref:uncharacterized protein LOC116169077 n=1 Tax=Photinus pyralis TaxID=7054 RepID=UPI0012672149|nr:uncharacterized protein LOC116169077 [Photinus pyralis]